ncbi:universal stress protein [Plantibacter sp. VKM Ac-2885]|uniref:universal stress protein n=1 Tax=Plantibacter sp. VKM Ac-2885 TaxID=2783828 RepID=UPI00188AC483|nr:universal stress protein [Plantibacter sp. VKM Ac-2885]MBF4511892.1 universal stress protein [Plantibacter sp. VKM Ac-2885]
MRYIVGYTDTPAGRDALALGIRIARTTGARLDIVLVLANEERPTITPADPGYERFLRETAERWLAEALDAVPADITAKTHLVYDESFAEGLLEASRILEGGLIIIGAARGGLLGRFTLGSVANTLLHSAVVPVALAPVGSRDLLDAQPTGGTVSRITCAIGTRSGAHQLLDAAIVVAKNAVIPLRLVSLVALDQPEGAEHPEATARAESHAAEVLAYATEHLPKDIDVTTEIASGTRIEDAVSHLEWKPAEIVLVGSSRLATPKHLFLGSTAAKMLRELPVPMVVVPRDSVLTLGDPT